MKGYTSRDRIEKYLLISIDASFHDQVEEWIEGIEAYIEKATGRVFVADAEASARYFTGDGTGRLLIDDAIEIVKVETGVDESGYGGMTEILVNDYLTVPVNAAAKGKAITGLNLRGVIWPASPYGSVKVTARWGYTEEAPADIRLAATILAAGIITDSDPSTRGVQSESVGRYSVSYRDDRQWKDFDRVQSILKSYKKFNF